jgi:hypothetical protein
LVALDHLYNQDIFGENADIFRPECLLSSNKNFKAMDQIVMTVFASGSRWECLDRNIVMIKLNKLFVEVSPCDIIFEQTRWILREQHLFRRFDFTLANPTNPWICFNAGLFNQTDLKGAGGDELI